MMANNIERKLGGNKKQKLSPRELISLAKEAKFNIVEGIAGCFIGALGKYLSILLIKEDAKEMKDTLKIVTYSTINDNINEFKCKFGKCRSEEERAVNLLYKSNLMGYLTAQKVC